MLLITHFWHAFLLVNLLFSAFPQPSSQIDVKETCWVVEDNKPFSNKVYCPAVPTADTTICSIDKLTGLGVGCATQADCPPLPKTNLIYCDSSAKYCCCQGNGCSDQYDDPTQKGHSCEDNPILEKTDLCKPPVYCLMPGKPHPEKCGEQPIGKPYCKLDPKTGDPLGCGEAYPKNSAECELLKPKDTMLVCNDKVCCCKGTSGDDNMPCNKLTMEACKIKELAGLDKCKDPTTLPMMNGTVPGEMTTTGATDAKKTTPGDEDTENSGKIWTASMFLSVAELFMIYILI